MPENEGGKAAFPADGSGGRHRAAIRNLDMNVRKVAGISGVAVMNDGRVAMTRDGARIAGLAHSRSRQGAGRGYP